MRILLTFNFQRRGHLVAVGLGGDHASVVQLAVLDDQLPLLALGNNLDPKTGDRDWILMTCCARIE